MAKQLTALAVPLPEIDTHVSKWRREHDPSGRAGVPAHLSVLVPFVPPAALGPDVTKALRDLFAVIPAFDVTFRATARFPNALWLAPEPSEPIVSLTGAVVARWPEHPPYEGAYPTVIPHLTVAYELSEEGFASIDADVSRLLPLSTRATKVHLFRGSNDTGWDDLEHFPLGG